MAGRSKKSTTAGELAAAFARIARDDNCEDIIVLDLRGTSPVTDYFVICTGTSDRQLQTVADDIAKHGKQVGQKVWRVAGAQQAQWIVMDFVDVVVHLFDQEHRAYYDLELIWGEAPRVNWEPQSE